MCGICMCIAYSTFYMCHQLYICCCCFEFDVYSLHFDRCMNEFGILDRCIFPFFVQIFFRCHFWSVWESLCVCTHFIFIMLLLVMHDAYFYLFAIVHRGFFITEMLLMNREIAFVRWTYSQQSTHKIIYDKTLHSGMVLLVSTINSIINFVITSKFVPIRFNSKWNKKYSEKTREIPPIS